MRVTCGNLLGCAAVAILMLSVDSVAHAQSGGKTAAQLLDEYRKRQQELANRGAQPGGGPGDGGQSGQIRGEWFADCMDRDRSRGVIHRDLGTFELVVQAGGVVTGTYRGDGSRYADSGRVQGNGAASGTAVPSGRVGAIAWQGTLTATGGTWAGSGSLTDTVNDCSGQWRTR